MFKVIKNAEQVEQERYDAAAESVRSQRDQKLGSTDWRVTKATETGVSLGSGWVAYRQALRDITDQTGFPYDVEWPTEPTG